MRDAGSYGILHELDLASGMSLSLIRFSSANWPYAQRDSVRRFRDLSESEANAEPAFGVAAAT